ncbi:MAG: cytochrome b/b6 domain-containing protein [Pseudomonadota bacterium]
MTGQALLREKVYDPILRLLHAWNGLAILLLVFTSQAAEALEFTPEAASLWRLHVWTGYALVLGLVGRLAWGLNGPWYARLSAMWHWRAWLTALRTRRLFTAPRGFGHHPLASAAYLGFYLVVLVMALTGLALAAIDQGRGPLYPWLGHAITLKHLFSEPHEILEKFVWFFILLHIAALILHEARHGVPLAQAMVSGYQYRKEEEE